MGQGAGVRGGEFEGVAGVMVVEIVILVMVATVNMVV